MSSAGQHKVTTKQVSLNDGHALQKAGRLDEAVAIYRAILKAHPDNTRGWNLIASVSMDKGDLAAAKRQFGRAIETNSSSAESHHNYGVVLRLLGDMEEARFHLEEALRLKPDYAEAYHNYVACRRFEPGDPNIKCLEDLLKKENLGEADRNFAHFALGKIYDDLGDSERAFTHYRDGNRLKGRTYDGEDERRYGERLRATFGKTLFDRFSGHGSDSEMPIFVVGMPRSGTTLTEQVLASHPQVFGAGERNDLDAIAKTLPQHANGESTFPDCLTDIDAAIPGKFGGPYLANVGAKASDEVRLVDKNPHNFKLLGLIAIMFPKARIVHCSRSPLDTCLSCYFQNFTNGQDFSFDLDDLAEFYSFYRGMMDHWTDVLPIPVFDLRYEELIADRERVTRELLSYCGLPWDDHCDRFYETKRPVRTASSWQVRQPLYSSSVDRWKAYESELQPLIRALGPLVNL